MKRKRKTGDAGSIYEPRRLQLNAPASSPKWLASRWSPPTRNVRVTNHLCPHYQKSSALYSWAFFVGTSAEHAIEGNLRFLNPCHFVTSPFRVASDKETAQWAFSASSLLCRIGYTDHSLWSGRAAPLLQLSAKVSLTRMPRR